MWGKYAQSSVDSVNENIFGYSEFTNIKFDTTIDSKTLRFRHIKGEAHQVCYNKQKKIINLIVITAFGLHLL